MLIQRHRSLFFRSVNLIPFRVQFFGVMLNTGIMDAVHHLRRITYFRIVPELVDSLLNHIRPFIFYYLYLVFLNLLLLLELVLGFHDQLSRVQKLFGQWQIRKEEFRVKKMRFRNLRGPGGIRVQKRNERAHLKHIHELTRKSDIQNLFIVRHPIQNFTLVLDH